MALFQMRAGTGARNLDGSTFLPMNSTPEKPLLALTMGDVNGIGPEILVKALARPEPWESARIVVYGSIAAYNAARAFAPNAPEAIAVSAKEAHDGGTGNAHVRIYDAGFSGPPPQPGMLDPQAGRAAVEWVKAAVYAALEGKIDGLVTGPISKSCIYQAGYHYIGHTELVAELCGTSEYRMCLFAGPYRIVHITGHMSLRQALDCVTRERVEDSIRLADRALRRMGFDPPRIAVAGLNPHAGEDGAFGSEEIDHIAPAITTCRAEGITCDGPHPPDTILPKLRDGRYDALIAMYHDQGHIPAKLVAMDEGVNVTLGVPIVRTSVDHGTAFDIAGKGIAREDSLCAAIAMAAQLSRLPE